MKKIKYSNWQLLYILIGYYICCFVSSQNPYSLPIFGGISLIYAVFLHCVIFAPVGLFVKYELTPSTITIFDYARRRTCVYQLSEYKTYKYKSVLAFLVISKDQIESKAEAKRKLTDGTAAFVVLLGEARSCLRAWEKNVPSLQ